MKKIIFILLLVNLTSCKNNDNYNKDAYLTIKVVNNLTNAPISERDVKVQKVKKSWINQYLWEYLTDTIVKTNQNGLVEIKINSSKRYGILVYSDSLSKMFTCSTEFEAKDLDLSEVLEIRYLDRSERANLFLTE